jgi:hypothetical protein
MAASGSADGTTQKGAACPRPCTAEPAQGRRQSASSSWPPSLRLATMAARSRFVPTHDDRQHEARPRVRHLQGQAPAWPPGATASLLFMLLLAWGRGSDSLPVMQSSGAAASCPLRPQGGDHAATSSPDTSPLGSALRAPLGCGSGVHNDAIRTAPHCSGRSLLSLLRPRRRSGGFLAVTPCHARRPAKHTSRRPRLPLLQARKERSR